MPATDQKSKRPIRILAWPKSRDSNTFPQRVTEALTSAGFETDDLTLRTLLRRPDAVLMHWPERIVRSSSKMKTIGHVTSMVLTVALLKARRVPLGLFLHNFRSHDQRYPRLEAWFYRFFDPQINALIHLSQHSLASVDVERPRLRPSRHLVVRHGADLSLLDELSPPKGSTRQTVQLTTFGAIREYKGYEALLDAFADVDVDVDVDEARVELTIRGSSPTEPLLSNLLSKAAADERVDVEVSFLSEEDLRMIVRDASAVVLPYASILNSGSAIHVLSEGGRVIGPRTGSLPEVQSDVGEDWVFLYDPPLRPDDLVNGIRWAALPKPTLAPDLSEYAWDVVSPQISDFIAEIASEQH